MFYSAVLSQVVGSTWFNFMACIFAIDHCSRIVFSVSVLYALTYLVPEVGWKLLCDNQYSQHSATLHKCKNEDTKAISCKVNKIPWPLIDCLAESITYIKKEAICHKLFAAPYTLAMFYIRFLYFWHIHPTTHIW